MGDKLKQLFSYRTSEKNHRVKKKIWFYKTLFSYLPVLFFVSSVLFLILFFAFSENIKKTTIRSNVFFANQINQSVNNTLSSIDKMIVKEMLSNETLHSFFDSTDLGKYDIYNISLLLKDMILNYPIIDSAYIFHQNDQMIVSDSIFTSLDNFNDRDFIYQRLSQHNSSFWTGKRSYIDVRKNDVKSVISMVKKYPFYTGDQGLIVVNIRVDTIRDLVKEMSNPESGFVHIFDSQGNFILSTNETIQSDLNISDVKNPLAKVKSNYSGWELYSGMDNANMFSFFSVFPFFWVLLGLLSIGVGIVWIFFITKQNYKPIETIMNRIYDNFIYKNSDLFNNRAKLDELRFIEMAIDDLMEQKNKFQNQYKENLFRIRQNLFEEIVKGNRPIDTKEWKHEMQRLGLHSDFANIVLTVLEIDKYYEFVKEYSDKDQYLLKFVINSVVNEIAQTQGTYAWTEWLSNERLGILYMLGNTDEVSESNGLSKVHQMSGTTLTWIKENLNFTVTIGIGGATDQIGEIPELYENALEALKYKPVLGNHRVINHSELLLTKPKMEIFNHVQFVNTIASSFHSGDPEWEAQYKTFFHDLKMGLFPREDIISLIHCLLYYLDRSMDNLPDQFRSLWKKDILPSLTDMLDHFEILEEFEERSYPILQKMGEEIKKLRNSQNHFQLIHKVKEYIEKNYHNPDLSLNHLNTEFDLSPSYLSQLFKDEFGENFIDYLVRIRIEEAKKLLIQTSEPVQDIARKVGYLHSFSFIRAFKKLVGKTPGEFRKKILEK